ncbi:MAG TPA: M3 family oligoendopeptidase, partial [Saprospiraceae bacterium]|nr:M3 family oligoendopeptidase [Saprospiraceae bacterium]
MTATLPAHETFESFPYERPVMAGVAAQFELYLRKFEDAGTLEEQIESLQQLNRVRESFSTMYNLCYVRHTVNTADPFYEDENNYFDENLPVYEELINRLYRSLIQSPFRPELEAKFGRQLFVLVELAVKTFQPVILEDLQHENALISEYTKLKAKVRIEFDGQGYNLSGLLPLELSDDRDPRRRAAEAKWAFYAGNSETIETIFDKMVRIRHQMAQKMGYQNFVEMGYARMRRSDYTPEMVANFRKQIRELIVPLAGELYARQRRRLGLEHLKYYDEEYKFPTGNPKPIGTPEDIVAAAARMYKDLSPETHRFFQFLQDTRLMDLVNRENKFPSGYCTYLSGFKSPFIFSNFTGTSGDIDVLTHEAGHAFQVWSSNHFDFDEYHWPTNDAAEIHSMSMEFFTWPWMHLFFGPDTEKYYFMHLGNALLFLPYGVAVDEFQHIIYQ